MEETLLSKIKWILLDKDGIQKRHEQIYDWQVKANLAINKIKFNEPEKTKELNILFDSLVRKTSAEKTLKVVQEISELLNLSNPATEFCTQACLSRTFGIKHIISIVLICFVPKNFVNNRYININYFNWKELYKENRKVWTKRNLDNIFDF